MMGQEEHRVSVTGLAPRSLENMAGSGGTLFHKDFLGPIVKRTDLKLRVMRATSKDFSQLLACGLTLACPQSGHTGMVPCQSCLHDPRGSHPAARHSHLGPRAGETRLCTP